jgi:hypothetical protein
MRKSIEAACLMTICSALSLATIQQGSAGPLSAAGSLETRSLVEEARHYMPPPGKECIKWTRRYHPSHGFGHKRCVHWR